MVTRRNGLQVSGHAYRYRQPRIYFVVDFRQRCTERLEHNGDVAADTQQPADAIVQYSAALALDLQNPHIFIKRSKVYLAKGLWEDALRDANQVRSSYLGGSFLSMQNH